MLPYFEYSDVNFSLQLLVVEADGMRLMMIRMLVIPTEAVLTP